MSTEVEKLGDIEDELNNQGTDLYSIDTELTDQGSTLDDIKTQQTSGGQKSQVVNSSGNIVTIDEHTNDIVLLVSRLREIILKKNTKYLFRITSKDNGSIVTYCGEWYENGA